MIRSINPFDLSLITELQEISDNEVLHCIESSERIFNNWKQTSFDYRGNLIECFAQLLSIKKYELASLITLEMGKPIVEAEAEIEKCVLACRYYVEHGAKFLADEPINNPNAVSTNHFISYEPIGTVLAIMPWNFPFWQVIRFAIPSLMAGNVALLKHASNVSLCAQAIEKTFLEAGFPEGAFQHLLINSSKIPQLINHRIVKAVTLTGSEKAGMEVAAMAGRAIKQSVLELGGNDPFIVLKNTNIAKAAKTAAKARMINNGQSCIAAKRFIIHEAHYDEFLSIMTTEFSNLNIGNPMNRTTQVGPMARIDLRDELAEQVKLSIQQGAVLHHGSLQNSSTDAFYTPSILTNIPVHSPAFSDELFGPVASVFKVKSDDEAIKLANNSRYGLGASLWTEDDELGKKLAKQLDCGMVFVNDMVVSQPYLPFGGTKLSGYGREMGESGIKEFVNRKTIVIKHS